MDKQLCLFLGHIREIVGFLVCFAEVLSDMIAHENSGSSVAGKLTV